jgi:hypothetical protein
MSHHHQIIGYAAGFGLMAYATVVKTLAWFGDQLPVPMKLADAPDALGGTPALYFYAGMVASVCTAAVAVVGYFTKKDVAEARAEFLQKREEDREQNDQALQKAKDAADAKDDARARETAELRERIFKAELASAIKDVQLKALMQGQEILAKAQDKTTVAVCAVADAASVTIDPPRPMNGGQGALDMMKANITVPPGYQANAGYQGDAISFVELLPDSAIEAIESDLQDAISADPSGEITLHWRRQEQGYTSSRLYFKAHGYSGISVDRTVNGVRNPPGIVWQFGTTNEIYVGPPNADTAKPVIEALFAAYFAD